MSADVVEPLSRYWVNGDTTILPTPHRPPLCTPVISACECLLCEPGSVFDMESTKKAGLFSTAWFFTKAARTWLSSFSGELLSGGIPEHLMAILKEASQRDPPLWWDLLSQENSEDILSTSVPSAYRNNQDKCQPAQEQGQVQRCPDWGSVCGPAALRMLYFISCNSAHSPVP